MAERDASRPVQERSDPGLPIRVITDAVTLKASASTTGNAYALFEIETPSSGGFPAHTQRHDDMGFYVIEGTYTFLINHRELVLGPGDHLHVPRGIRHGYINSGQEPARMLILATPGHAHEQFFHEIGDPVDRPAWEPDMARFLAVAPGYGIEIPTAGAE